MNHMNIFDPKFESKNPTEKKRLGSVSIKLATLDDVKGIYQVAASVGKGRKESAKGFLMDNYLENPKKYKEKFKQHIENLRYMYTARESGVIIGFLMAYTKDEWLENNPNWLSTTSWKPDFDMKKTQQFVVIDKTAIQAGLTGNGVGSKLYTRLIKDLRRDGIEHIFSETLIDPVPNFASLAFRKKQAYNLAGTRFETYKGAIYTDLIYYKPVKIIDKASYIVKTDNDSKGHSN